METIGPEVGLIIWQIIVLALLFFVAFFLFKICTLVLKIFKSKNEYCKFKKMRTKYQSIKKITFVI